MRKDWFLHLDLFDEALWPARPDVAECPRWGWEWESHSARVVAGPLSRGSSTQSCVQAVGVPNGGDIRHPTCSTSSYSETSIQRALAVVYECALASVPWALRLVASVVLSGAQRAEVASGACCAVCGEGSEASVAFYARRSICGVRRTVCHGASPRVGLARGQSPLWCTPWCQGPPKRCCWSAGAALPAGCLLVAHAARGPGSGRLAPERLGPLPAPSFVLSTGTRRAPRSGHVPPVSEVRPEALREGPYGAGERHRRTGSTVPPSARELPAGSRAQSALFFTWCATLAARVSGGVRSLCHLALDPFLFVAQVVIVTGGNQGIGYVTARQLASQGAKVVLACRSKERGERAAGEVKAAFMPLELSSQASVRSFASAFLEKYGRLDILVNNAGVMACPLERTEEGYEMQLATNHLGHFLLTVLLKSVLEQCKGRVVALSSAAASQMSMGTMPFGHADIHWDDIHAVRQDQVHPISGVRPVEALQRPHVPGDPEALLWSAGGKCSPWLDGHRAHEAHRELMPAVPAPLLLEEEGRRWRLARSGGGRPDDTALRPVVPRGPRERGVLLAKGHLHGQGGAGRWVANAAAQPERHGAVSRQAVGREPAIVRARSLDLELLERAAALERALPRTPLPPFRLQTRVQCPQRVCTILRILSSLLAALRLRCLLIIAICCNELVRN
ncbi:unnamed protein product [Prorocentrum cordatum]|uniref:Protochlorophyllide reductase n=1 Tax=Prorocentrum cordatum TaxID=2364126 RepID=A0ABN9XK27_9DINO|nr:unnamed protein product [Polarella glacialis]